MHLLMITLVLYYINEILKKKVLIKIYPDPSFHYYNKELRRT